MRLGAFLLLLHLGLLAAFHRQQYLSFEYAPVQHDGGWPLPATALALASLGYTLYLAISRGQTPRWAALWASLGVAAFGLLGLRPEAGEETRRLLRWWSKPDDFEGLAVIRFFDALGSVGYSAHFGALIAFSGAIALAARARRNPGGGRRASRAWLALLAAGGWASLHVLFNPWHAQVSFQTLVPGFMAAVVIVLILLVAPALDDEPADERRALLGEAVVLGQVAVSLAGFSASITALLCVDSTDRDYWFSIGTAGNAMRALPRGFASFLALPLLLGALGRLALRRREGPPWSGPLASAALGAPLLSQGALWLLLAAHLEAVGEGRLGAAGELVLDRRIPEGELWVDLLPAVASTDAAAPASISLAGVPEPLGQARERSAGAPAIFQKLPAGTTLSIQATGPYEFKPIDVKLAPGKGARVGVPVLRHEPARRLDSGEPVFRLALSTRGAPPQLFLTRGGTVFTSMDLPDSADERRERLTREWKTSGSHRDPYDRKSDTLVLVHEPGMPFDRLAAMAAEASGITRDFRHVKAPVFRLFTSSGWPLSR